MRTATGIAPTSPPAGAGPLAARRAALWGLLAAKLVGSWGLGWDIRWHLLVGRDSFWIPPHLMTYAAVAAGTLLAFGVLAGETRQARRGAVPPGAVSVLGLWGTPGYHLAAAGMVVTLLAAPADEAWHRAFGLDVTLWSPPHLLGLAGAQANTLGCLLAATELWPPGSRARRVAVLAAGTFLLGGFEIVVDPAVRLAFLHGGRGFFLWGVLAALLVAFTLVLVARLDDWRGAPLAVAAGAVLMQLVMFAVADVGFAVLRPASTIAEAIAADPTSPVAVAHEMARRNGTEPGRSLTLRLFPVLPAALMLPVDARRRPLRAALTLAAGLLAVSGVGLARLPALRHALPSAADAAAGGVLGLLAGLAGAAGALAVAGAFQSLRRPRWTSSTPPAPGCTWSSSPTSWTSTSTRTSRRSTTSSRPGPPAGRSRPSWRS